MVSDIVRAALIPNKGPGHFLIEFFDKTYKYESEKAGRYPPERQEQYPSSLVDIISLLCRSLHHRGNRPKGQLSYPAQVQFLGVIITNKAIYRTDVLKEENTQGNRSPTQLCS